MRIVCRLLGVKPGDVFTVDNYPRPPELYRITEENGLEWFFVSDKAKGSMWQVVRGGPGATLDRLLTGYPEVCRIYPNSPLKDKIVDGWVYRCDYFAGGWHRPGETELHYHTIKLW